ncbi:MAG TPA: hypothetical protein VK034_10005, partial [Enhygromyxa sp.]|nr:hypothetical protein [Enhygromyxa sp.]
ALGLAAGQSFGLNRIAVDDTHVYYTAPGDSWILRRPKAGGEQTTVAGIGSRTLTINGGQLFWADFDYADPFCNQPPWDGAVGVVSVDGTNQQTLAPMAAPLGVAADSTHVYWTDICDHTVNRMPREGGAIEQLGDWSSPEAIVADEAGVFWKNGLDIIKLVK